MIKLDISVKIFLIITVLFAGILVIAMLGQKNPEEIELVDPSDPLLIDAKRQAAATLDSLYVLYPKYPQNSYVRFRFVDHKNIETHVWGKVIMLDAVSLRVTDINAHADNKFYAYPKFFDLTREQIEDWLVETDNDSVRGGFTTQVILLRKMQNHPQLKDSILPQLGLFLDELK